jgi:hypothetical protein
MDWLKALAIILAAAAVALHQITGGDNNKKP